MTSSQTSFKVGLALAGAASAGAYTAGVLDFLVEAMDAWYAARARGERVPRHDVSLEVASGASAGAMCAALLSVALPYSFPHVRLDQNRRPSAGASGNPFYSAWVEKIDIRRMLETADLAGGRLGSLLDSTVLDEILREALDFRGSGPAQRPYVARPFVNRYTLGNLRGVPYDVSYRGLMPASDTMYAHDDFLGFLVGGDGLPAPHGCGKGHQRVGEFASSQAPDWQRLGNAALASGAFPLALKPRLVSRNAADYAVRGFDEPDASDPAQHRVRVPPAWPGQTPPPDYSFVSVDGGFFTNEPLDLARGVITDPVAGNPADGLRSNGAVLMIAPLIALPSSGETLPAAPAPHQLLQPLFWSLVDQCRFRPADIALAHDPDVYNRFLVTPVDSKSWAKGATWVAGGPLQGFFGFLHEDYRKHDYQLGRNNCQRFLRQDFRLPQDNPCVAYGYAELPELRQELLDDDGTLPLIPLLGTAAQNEPPCDWPVNVLDLEALMKPVGARVDAVYRYYRDSLGAAAGGGLQGLLAKGYLQVGWLAGRPQLIGAIRQAIADALQQQRL